MINRIATILGARPQFIKSSQVSKEIKNNDIIEEIIIHTGQHFDKNMSSVFFEEMGLSTPKYNLGINQLDYGAMVNLMVDKISPILKEEKISGVLVYGDTNSTLAGSLAASKLNIPIFHVESGLRSYNKLMYEEINRTITDHLSSLLFCPTINSVDNLKKEKITKGVIYSGDVMYDSFLEFSKKDNTKEIKNKDYSKYILATIHRRENLDSYSKLSTILSNLDKINETNKIVMPLHPHTKIKLQEYNIKSKISFIEPLGYLSLISLINKCSMVITDSGGLQKEAFFAKKKCLTVREETEWIELINQGVNMLCEPENLNKAYNKIIKEECDFSINLYGKGDASKFIIQSIENFFS